MKLGGVSIVERVVSQLEVALDLVSCASEVASGDFASVAEAAFREPMGSVDRNDWEMLLKVVNLLLTYGEGMLLLSDTTLEMRKDSCHGVVCQYEGDRQWEHCGMPKRLKCVHVDDSKLGEVSKSCLSAFEYLREMAFDIGVTNASRDTLLSVGF